MNTVYQSGKFKIKYSASAFGWYVKYLPNGEQSEDNAFEGYGPLYMFTSEFLLAIKKQTDEDITVPDSFKQAVAIALAIGLEMQEKVTGQVPVIPIGIIDGEKICIAKINYLSGFDDECEGVHELLWGVSGDNQTFLPVSKTTMYFLEKLIDLIDVNNDVPAEFVLEAKKELEKQRSEISVRRSQPRSTQKGLDELAAFHVNNPVVRALINSIDTAKLIIVGEIAKHEASLKIFKHIVAGDEGYEYRQSLYLHGPIIRIEAQSDIISTSYANLAIVLKSLGENIEY